MNNYDVLIIGSGVSGALAASELAAAGLRVLILEAGDEFHQRQDYLNRYYSADRDKQGWSESVYPMSPQARFPSVNVNNDYVIQNGREDERFKMEYIRIVGGTTLYWLGTALRMHPNDFRLQTLYGKGNDWPLSYHDLEPWYCRAESELGVAGNPQDFPELPRSAPYPMPELPMSYLGNAIKKQVAGEKFDDKEIIIAHTPQARNSIAGYQDRPACAGFHSCIPLCPIQAKYDALVHLNKARQHHAVIQAQSVVYEIAADNDGNITHVKYMRWDGSKHETSARIYILAAHGVESPKLLLNSQSDRYPLGIANRSDMVGRNLMDHPAQMSYALTNDPIYPFLSPFSTSGIESLNDGVFRKNRAAFRVQISDTGWAWPTGSPYSAADKLIADGYFGEELNQQLREHVTRQVSLVALTEMLPERDNRVTLAKVTDSLGIPRPQITFKIGDYSRAGLARARDLHKLIFDKLKVSEQHHFPDDKWQGSGHIMGTTIMGENPQTSVVDKNLRCHDHANLFILGSSVFPSSFTSNPTLTIAALALRAADHLKKILAAGK